MKIITRMSFIAIEILNTKDRDALTNRNNANLNSHILIKDYGKCDKRIYKHEESIEIPIVVRNEKIKKAPR